MALVQAQRIMTNSKAPATSTNITSDGHFSTNTFRTFDILSKHGPRGRFSAGPLYRLREGYRGAFCRSMTIAIARA